MFGSCSSDITTNCNICFNIREKISNSVMDLLCVDDNTLKNEHAARVNSKQISVVDCLKSISAIIGGSHILAVFEENDFIKVYFDDKRHVDILIRSCLHAMGRHIRVDYFTPPGTKLVLSNVDPVITNYDIISILSIYGTVVSPVICPPISDDIEFCHIVYGVRYVYMNLNGCIPDRLEFKYGDQLCYIKILIVETPDSITFLNIKGDEDRNRDQTTNEEVASNSSVESLASAVGPSNKSLPVPDLSDPPVLLSIENVSSEPKCRISCGITKQNVSPKLILEESSEAKYFPSVQTGKNVSSPVKMRRGRPCKKLKKLTATSRAAKKIKNNMKQNYLKRHIKHISCKSCDHIEKA